MRALTRAIADSFVDALRAHAGSPRPDVVLARRQHAEYLAALSSSGCAVETLPADSHFPDGCFVEDCAVVAGDVALITRSAVPSREGERAAVARALAPWVRVEYMAAPATLDGGDCLRVGRRIYVGRSARTNAAGHARLSEVFGPLGFEVIGLDLPPGVLHLKSVCSPLADGRVLLAEQTLPPGSFGDHATVLVPAAEAAAANCVALGDAVLLAAGFPRTAAALEAAGMRSIPLDTSEFRKADGALTCLSIIV